MGLPQHLLEYIDCYKGKNSYANDGKIYELILILGAITLALANVYAKKIISVFGFNVSLSGVIFPFTFLFLTIINEVYGHQKCGRAVVALLVGQFAFITLIWQFSLISSPHLTLSSEKINVSLFNSFNAYGQVLLGSMLAVSLSFYFFSILNSSLKIKLCQFNPMLRFLISAGLSKAILVIVAYSINLWEVVTPEQLIKICVYTWCLKMLIAILIITVSIPIISLVKRLEKIDVYDLHASYNPFKLYSKDSKGINLYEAIAQSRSIQ